MITLFMLKQDCGYLQADGLDDALVGFIWPKETNLKTAVYDSDEIIKILQERDGMTTEDAIEFFDFNIRGAYVGPQTPRYLKGDWE
jgi:hypothetical protein